MSNKHRGAKVGEFEPVHHIQLEPTSNKSIVEAMLNKNNVLSNKIIEEHFPYIIKLCKKYPNDMDLGNKIREYLNRCQLL